METLQTLPPMERILFLRKVPLFAELPAADLKQLAGVAGERHYADGDTLMRQGDPGDELHVIVSGEVRVLAEDDLGRRELARRSVGDCVGEMALISREPRAATLVAEGAVRTLVIGQKAFEAILRQRPETGLAVMRQLCARLRESTAGPRPAPAASPAG